MAGNIWDWVSDTYANDYYMTSPKINPQGPQPGLNKVIRGACYVNKPFELRSANRFFAAATFNYSDIGFRCAAPAVP
jgi:formylglycine-generating enzyme required for sulfatase activity